MFYLWSSALVLTGYHQNLQGNNFIFFLFFFIFKWFGNVKLCDEFEKNFRKVYPQKLEFKKENDINTEGSFLYLGIKITDNRFPISLYDKQDSFPFSIVTILCLRSNIPFAFKADILKTFHGYVLILFCFMVKTDIILVTISNVRCGCSIWKKLVILTKL